MWRSRDYGATWTCCNPAEIGWRSVCCDSAGETVVASAGAALFMSSDGGETWTEMVSDLSETWTCVRGDAALSAIVCTSSTGVFFSVAPFDEVTRQYLPLRASTATGFAAVAVTEDGAFTYVAAPGAGLLVFK
jgi:photosystem II stability/assembly factor-like uncharacterized protein